MNPSTTRTTIMARWLLVVVVVVVTATTTTRTTCAAFDVHSPSHHGVVRTHVVLPKLQPAAQAAQQQQPLQQQVPKQLAPSSSLEPPKEVSSPSHHQRSRRPHHSPPPRRALPPSSSIVEARKRLPQQAQRQRQRQQQRQQARPKPRLTASSKAIVSSSNNNNNHNHNQDTAAAKAKGSRRRWRLLRARRTPTTLQQQQQQQQDDDDNNNNNKTTTRTTTTRNKESTTTMTLGALPQQQRRTRRTRRTTMAPSSSSSLRRMKTPPKTIPRQQQQQQRRHHRGNNRGRRGKAPSLVVDTDDDTDDTDDDMAALVVATPAPPGLSLARASVSFPTSSTTTTTRSQARQRRRSSSSSSSSQQQQQQQQHSLRRSSSPGLTRQEELYCSFCIRRLRTVVRLRDQLSDSPKSSESDWAAACGVSLAQLRHMVQEGHEARTHLCAANVGLVTHLAHAQYQKIRASHHHGSMGTILTLQDLIQEGNLGLMEAADRFEPEKGFRFSTYAVYWIRQRIVRAVSSHSRTIRLPAHVHGMLHKIHKTRVDLQGKLGRPVSVQEVAQQLRVTPQKVLHYTASSRHVVSLESPLRSTNSFKDNRPTTLGEILAADGPTPEEDVETEDLRNDLWHLMETVLTVTERRVLVERFGLSCCQQQQHANKNQQWSGKPKSVAETALLLEISRERVRVVEARALNKLRHPQRNYRLREYVTALPPALTNKNHNHHNAITTTTTTTTRTTTTTNSNNTRRCPISGMTNGPRTHLTTSEQLTLPAASSSLQQSLQHQQQQQQQHRPDRFWFF